MTPLVILGAGRHGRELESYLKEVATPVELLGFIDEARPPGPFGNSKVLGGFEVVPDLMARYGGVFYITATGDNPSRRRLAALAETAQLTPWTLVHRSAQVGNDSTIGAGSLLAPGVVLTRAVSIGQHVIANVGVTVSHDSEIGNYVNLNPGVTVCGDVVIGEGSYLGAGATVIDKVSIGPDTVVGAGAVVVDDLPAGVLAIGVPARIVRELHSRPRLV